MDHREEEAHFSYMMQRVREVNRANGWTTPGHADLRIACEGNGLIAGLILAKLALVTTEVSEAVEVIREGFQEGRDPVADFTEELADVVIRVMDLAEGMDLNLTGAILAKIEKNASRGFRHGGKTI